MAEPLRDRSTVWEANKAAIPLLVANWSLILRCSAAVLSLFLTENINCISSLEENRGAITAGTAELQRGGVHGFTLRRSGPRLLCDVEITAAD